MLLAREVGNPLNARYFGAFFTKIPLLSPPEAPFCPGLSSCAKPWTCPAPNNCRDSKLCHRKAKVDKFPTIYSVAEGNSHLAQHTSRTPSLFAGWQPRGAWGQHSTTADCGAVQRNPRSGFKNGDFLFAVPLWSTGTHGGGGVAAAYRCSVRLLLKTSMWVFAKGAFFFFKYILFSALLVKQLTFIHIYTAHQKANEKLALRSCKALN